MPRVVLHDIDSVIPNLALMKLSAHYRRLGWEVLLSRPRSLQAAKQHFQADRHLASKVFYTERSHLLEKQLQQTYGGRVEFGGSGHSLETRLPPELDGLFPDYSLYKHRLYALGFLTRGCNKRCSFCVVPTKEGRLKQRSSSFDDFVPTDQRNVMLLDDNLLAFQGVESLLQEIGNRRYSVNFSQTLDIAYLTEAKFRLLRQIDYQASRFNNPMIFFSLNDSRTIKQFEKRRSMLKDFGKDCVTVVCIYGFDTSLSEDFERFRTLKRLHLIPFFQEYWPIAGVPARLPENFFDMDLNRIIRLTFRSNGYNWEKYLGWLNRLYFKRFGRFYRPLVEILFRYNNKHRYEWYRERPDWLTTELYRDYRDTPPDRAKRWLNVSTTGRHVPRGVIPILHSLDQCFTPSGNYGIYEKPRSSKHPV